MVEPSRRAVSSHLKRSQAITRFGFSLKLRHEISRVSIHDSRIASEAIHSPHFGGLSFRVATVIRRQGGDIDLSQTVWVHVLRWSIARVDVQIGDGKQVVIEP